MKSSLPFNVDVVVVGAGTAGCSAAIPPAQAGLDVLLVEKTSAADVGRKVCGNAISTEGLKEVAGYIDLPSGPEVAVHIEGGTVYVTDDDAGTFVPIRGLVINRVIFGRRMLADAVSAGAHLAEGVSCTGWADRSGGRIRLRPGDGEAFDVSARVVIDASGFRSVLTRSGGPTRTEQALRSEVGVGYREILSLRKPLDGACGGSIQLGPPGAERGYAWVFPMGGTLANVGVGRTLDNDNVSLKNAFDAFVGGRTELAGAETVSAGAGMLPLRRPLDSLVGDGFMSVGDAACQASPLHGGGIAPSIIAGVMAGEQAVEAVKLGDTTASGLWGYAVRYMRSVGAAYAAHEVLRELVYTLPRRDLAFLASEYVKANALVAAVSAGNLLPSFASGMRRLASLASRPSLVAHVIRSSRMVARVKQHYLEYPESPDRLESWAGHAAYLRRSARQ
jgi:digeranylgeranylglycerophospholipid reductase